MAGHVRWFIEGTLMSLGIWPFKMGGLSRKVATKVGFTVYVFCEWILSLGKRVYVPINDNCVWLLMIYTELWLLQKGCWKYHFIDLIMFYCFSCITINKEITYGSVWKKWFRKQDWCPVLIPHPHCQSTFEHFIFQFNCQDIKDLTNLTLNLKTCLKFIWLFQRIVFNPYMDSVFIFEPSLVLHHKGFVLFSLWIPP